MLRDINIELKISFLFIFKQYLIWDQVGILTKQFFIEL